MGNPTVKELAKAGIDFGSYRDLSGPAMVGQAAARWPLLALTDQILLAERWKRETLAQGTRLPNNVTQLPASRPAPVQTGDWFHAGGAPPVQAPRAAANGQAVPAVRSAN
ncbi:MAG: hypothetical protein IT385_09440 [Deltaproteobacteria bacterium]|nr:hypothetical protein [Deltaproteobacteria bacterium]